MSGLGCCYPDVAEEHGLPRAGTSAVLSTGTLRLCDPEHGTSTPAWLDPRRADQARYQHLRRPAPEPDWQSLSSPRMTVQHRS